MTVALAVGGILAIALTRQAVDGGVGGALSAASGREATPAPDRPSFPPGPAGGGSDECAIEGGATRWGACQVEVGSYYHHYGHCRQYYYNARGEDADTSRQGVSCPGFDAEDDEPQEEEGGEE